MPDAFYVPDGDRFHSTEWTRGPWTPEAQHAGPPAALIGRAVEALDAPAPMHLARLTVEIPRPIPVAPLRVEARAVRTGRRVQLAEARLSADGEEVARASAWRILRADDAAAEIALEPTPHEPPDACGAFEHFRPPWEPSYLTAIEWRKASGSFLEPGPAAAWMRMRVPLVEGEEPSASSRVLAAADSGNGISATLPIDRFLFINTELTVHLVRPPETEWVCLDAITRIGARGTGLAQSTIWDERGRIGAGAQALFVGPRSPLASRKSDKTPTRGLRPRAGPPYGSP